MKTLFRWLCLSILLCVNVSRGEEDCDYEISPIKSIDDIQGTWVSSPEGFWGFTGCLLRITDGWGTFEIFTDTGLPEHKPTDFTLEVAHGALFLVTKADHITKKKWYLATVGKHRCLIAMHAHYAPEFGTQPLMDTLVLYYHPPKGSKNGEQPAKEASGE